MPKTKSALKRTGLTKIKFKNPALLVIIVVIVAAGLFFVFGTFATGGANDPGGNMYKDHYGCPRNPNNRPYLSRGARGKCVLTLQDDLLSIHMSVGRSGLDGIYGADTEATVRWFQATRGISPATGAVDRTTWIFLSCEAEGVDCP